MKTTRKTAWQVRYEKEAERRRKHRVSVAHAIRELRAIPVGETVDLYEWYRGWTGYATHILNYTDWFKSRFLIQPDVLESSGPSVFATRVR